MKANQLTRLFLCLLLILGLQGCGQKKGANISGKNSDVATTNEVVSRFAQLKANAERGDAKAQCDLGKCYAEGKDVAQDNVEAAKWYGKAAEQGDAHAEMEFSSMCFYGKGVPQNNAEAIKWLRKAAEQGDAKTEYNVGNYFSLGIGVPKDDTEAGKWFLKAAEKGNADAQCSLGFCYLRGIGVAQDKAEAAKWFLKAGEQGDPSAQGVLGDCYENGEGVPKDYAEAAKWYRKAAEQGNFLTQIDLGNCYKDGEGVPKDYVEAYKWFNLAASSEQWKSDWMIERIKTDLNSLEAMMTPEQIAQAQELSREFRPRKESGSANFISSDSPTASGTGFFITDDGYLVSNYHVVKDATKVRLLTSAGLIDAKVVQVDAANDLALLKADGRFALLPIAASRTVNLGGTVATVGFPDIGLQGFAPKLAKGEIASLSGASDDPRYFQISVPVQPGNSGGALVDERGNVIGIVSAKLNASAALAASGALPENVNYAVKSSFLLSFLESVPAVSAKLKAPGTADRKFEDVVKSAQDAAVLVLVY
ncbi:MAG: tetratricopeptide repeat-containing serine protease family protein [Verrucomicrobiota bacterium]